MLKEIIDNLIKLAGENEWVEFKSNFASPQYIGECLAALSNAACLAEQEIGYLIFGIDNITHEIKGTNYIGIKEKVGNENIENWLRTQLEPRTDFKIEEFYYDSDHRLVIFSIDAANQSPVGFKGVEFIRVGSYKKRLREHPEKAAKLWEKLKGKTFERELAIQAKTDDEILKLLAYPHYFEEMNLPLPSNKEGILNKLVEEGLIVRDNNLFHITNLGAILFAKNLSDFDKLSRKVIRVIQYKDRNKIQTLKENTFTKGYAISIAEVINYINNQLPSNEQIGKAFRSEVKMYPDIAIRELVVNAIVHQDFRETGTGVLIEIYKDRIEISNPGKPLIPIIRFIDHNPKSRNERLAQFMRRLNICEERGSGIDKVVFSCEVYQLPAPNFSQEESYLKVSLYAYKTLREMDKEDKIRACYQHCVLKRISNSYMNNQSFRERLGINEKNYATVSRIISDTIDEKLIKYDDPNNKSNKYRKYIPFWA